MGTSRLKITSESVVSTCYLWTPISVGKILWFESNIYIYIYTHVVIGLIIFFWGDLPRLYWLHKHVSRSVSILVVEFHVFLSVEEFEKHSTMFFE